MEHSGSMASLEEWVILDRKRRHPDYVPSGWKGLGVKMHALPGQEFDLVLTANDKRALVASIKTL